MREAYASLDGPVLVLIGALIPVGEAIHATGGADLVAGRLSQVLGGAPPLLALASIMLLAMISAPFMHNAPTVLVFGPIAAGLAQRLRLNPDAFLMAVAVGRGQRLPHADRPPVQHPGHGAGRLPVLRLPAGLGAPLSLVVLVVGHGADRVRLGPRGLAQALSQSRERGCVNGRQVP